MKASGAAAIYQMCHHVGLPEITEAGLLVPEKGQEVGLEGW